MKPVVLIIVVALVGGLVVGAGMTGIVNIPGLTPAKKKSGAAALYGDKGADGMYAADKDDPKKKEAAKKPAKPKATPAKAVVAPTIDPTLGYKKIAKLWNSMDAAKIKEQIDKGWKEKELACIFNKMDTSKVAEVLALLDQPKALKLTKAIQAEASKLPPAPGK